MKQRIRVVNIVRRGDDILLLKRNLGRIESEPVWELPTGKIAFGEQPEEAMSRVMNENLGVTVSNVTLKDVITFTALTGASRLYNLYIVFETILDEDVKLTLDERYTQYKFLKYNSDSISGMKLNEASQSVLEIELGVVNRNSLVETVETLEGTKSGMVNVPYRSAANGATIYTDGSSRGNPGPSGIGYFIIDQNGNEVKRGGEFIGFATSRVAEYYALKEGCEQAIDLGLKSVRFVSDNLMMVNQMNGVYRIKNKDLLPLYNDIRNLLKQFDAVAFIHVTRDYNKEADEQANLAIDRHFDETETIISGDEK
jgi:ribonuclease HI/ADP-ribose pyrophosphatase YjhB (NUDIX family)